ncbi:MAG: TonB family protein [Alphaproteobacteria bacterium]|nr:TonB family protein [Alphaproteobacteria bacterium]
MHLAFPGSALVHAGVIGLALVGFAWPEPDDAAAPAAVSVSIIATATVSTNTTSTIQSDSTVDLVSAGAAPTTPAVIEPLAPDEPIAPLPPAAAAPPVERVADIVPLASTALTPQSSPPVPPAPAERLEPVESHDFNAAPVPQTLSIKRTDKPTYPKPTVQQPREIEPTTAQSTPAGNGGANAADSVAAAGSAAPSGGAGSGGDAAVARYPSQVLSKLRRALRGGNLPHGEVVVRFTVAANGNVSGVGIGRSSGNAAIDAAGVATVNRAAPFPPIPPAAARSNWTFDVPLAFGS